MQLLEWWNLIFELPFLVAFVIVLVMATGAVPMGEASGETDHDLQVEHSVDMGHDVGHDLGHDMGHDLSHDVAADHSADVSHDLHHDIAHDAGHAGDHAADAEHHSSWSFVQLLAALGIGQVPMALIFMSLSVIWGFVGWTSNQVLGEVVKSPVVFVPISVLLASIGSVGFTRYLARGLSRLIPSVETYGVTRERLLGKTGEARYPISETFGEALVRDRYGQLHLVSCHTLPGKEVIPSGSKVVLYQFDSDQDVFYVVTEMELQILTSRYARRPGKEA